MNRRGRAHRSPFSFAFFVVGCIFIFSFYNLYYMKKSELKMLVKEVIKESMAESQLFFWNSHVPKDKRQKIINWVNSLSKEQQEMIDIISSEGYAAGEWNEGQNRGDET